MGAALAGCRAVPVAVNDQWCLRLDSVDPDDAARALCLWVNTPGNPAGGLEDLGAIAHWGRDNGVAVFSDECYIEFTWGADSGASILHHSTRGVVAVHSLSKRSNMAGVRAGFYAGDPELVGYLSEIRKHAGMMVPGPAQAAAAAAFGEDGHVDAQRALYKTRLSRLRRLFSAFDPGLALPGGGLYLWVASPDGDGWSLARRAAEEMGALVSPGEFYGPQGVGHIRVAAVAPDARIDLLEQRMATPQTDTVGR